MPRTTIAKRVFAVVCAMALIGGYALVTSAEAPSTCAPVTHQASSPVLGRPRPEAPRGSRTMAPAGDAGASSDHVTKVVNASTDTFIAPDVGESRGDWPYIEVGGGRVGLLKIDLNGVIPPGAEVTDAYLALYLTDYTEGCELASFGGLSMVSAWTEDSLRPQAYFNVRLMARAWTEDSLWTEAHTGIGTDVIGSFTVDIPYWRQWTGCDVTFQTRQWLSGQTPNHGLAVTTESDDWFRFFSGEGCPEHAPHLAIRYIPQAPPSKVYLPLVQNGD